MDAEFDVPDEERLLQAGKRRWAPLTTFIFSFSRVTGSVLRLSPQLRPFSVLPVSFSDLTPSYRSQTSGSNHLPQRALRFRKRCLMKLGARMASFWVRSLTTNIHPSLREALIHQVNCESILISMRTFAHPVRDPGFLPNRKQH